VTASSSGAKFECFSSPFDLLYLSIGNLWLSGPFEHKRQDGLFQIIEGRDKDLGRLDIRRHSVCLFQLDWMLWLGHWARGRLLYQLTLRDHLNLSQTVRSLGLKMFPHPSIALNNEVNESQKSCTCRSGKARSIKAKQMPRFWLDLIPGGSMGSGAGMMQRVLRLIVRPIASTQTPPCYSSGDMQCIFLTGREGRNNFRNLQKFQFFHPRWNISRNKSSIFSTRKGWPRTKFTRDSTRRFLMMRTVCIACNVSASLFGRSEKICMIMTV
jgi:hypothetical protein